MRYLIPCEFIMYYKLLIQTFVYPFTTYNQSVQHVALQTNIVEFSTRDWADDAADMIRSNGYEHSSMNGTMITKVTKLYKEL